MNKPQNKTLKHGGVVDLDVNLKGLRITMEKHCLGVSMKKLPERCNEKRIILTVNDAITWAGVPD